MFSFFPDQAWFFNSAAESLFSGKFPLHGITTSITWLHQGPLWTYLLIPIMVTNNYVLSGTIFISLLNVFLFPLAYYLGALIKGKYYGLTLLLLTLTNGFLISNFSVAYHTSPIPLFTVIFFLLFKKRHWFLAGLFLGFLYQLHLLCIIFWSYILLTKTQFPISKFILGFTLGILPFIISGPIATFGILFWFIKFFAGFSSSSGISAAYQSVLIMPVLLVLSFVLTKALSAVLNRFLLK